MLIDISILSQEPDHLVVLHKLATNGFVEMVWKDGECKYYTTRQQLEILTSMDMDTLCEILLRR